MWQEWRLLPDAVALVPPPPPDARRGKDDVRPAKGPTRVQEVRLLPRLMWLYQSIFDALEIRVPGFNDATAVTSVVPLRCR